MKRLKSVFTEDMDHCYFTGAAPVERHHIFGGANRKLSEEYGFVVPLRPDLHPNGAGATWSESLKKLDDHITKGTTEPVKTSVGSLEASHGYDIQNDNQRPFRRPERLHKGKPNKSV